MPAGAGPEGADFAGLVGANVTGEVRGFTVFGELAARASDDFQARTEAYATPALATRMTCAEQPRSQWAFGSLAGRDGFFLGHVSANLSRGGGTQTSGMRPFYSNPLLDRMHAVW